MTDSLQAHNSYEEIEEAPSVASSGIKRTLGSRKPPSPPKVEEPPTSEPEEAPPLVAQVHRGIKRTIGSRKPVERAPSEARGDATPNTERAGSQLPTPLEKEVPQAMNGNAVKQEDDVEPDPEEALRRADDKRRALKRQLAQSTTSKPKKRKF